VRGNGTRDKAHLGVEEEDARVGVVDDVVRDGLRAEVPHVLDVEVQAVDHEDAGSRPEDVRDRGVHLGLAEGEEVA
jgi:hypothetical protein